VDISVMMQSNIFFSYLKRKKVRGHSLLLLSIIIWLMFLYYKYSQNNFLPLGYDPPVYIYNANEILRVGLVKWTTQYENIEPYAMILAAIGLIIGNTTTAWIIVSTIISIAYIYMNYKLIFKLTNSHEFAGLGALFSAISVNIVVLYRVQYQMLSFVLVMLVFSFNELFSDKLNMRNNKFWGSVFIGAFIYTVHLFRTFSLFILTLGLAFIITKYVSVLKYIIFSSLFGLLSQSPFLLSQFFFFLNPSQYGAVYVPYPFTWDIITTFLIDYGGGSYFLLLVSMVGYYYLLKNWLKNKNMTALFILLWNASMICVSLILMTTTAWFYRWHYYAERCMRLIMTPILLSIALYYSRNRLKYTLNFVYNRKSYLNIKLSSILVFFMFFFVIGGTSIQTRQVYERHLRFGLVQYGFYEDIEFVINELNERNYTMPPIFPSYNCKPGVNLFSDYEVGIKMLLGKSYFYYGNLNYLFFGSRTPSIVNTFSSSSEWMIEDRAYFEMNENLILDDVLNHPIVIIRPWLYNSEVDSFFNYFKIKNNIYIIPPNSLSLVNSTLDKFFSEEYWSLMSEITKGNGTILFENYSDDTEPDNDAVSPKLATVSLVDDNQTDFWRTTAWGNGGSIATPNLSNDPYEKQAGTDSLMIDTQSGEKLQWQIFHDFSPTENWLNTLSLKLNWYGAGSDKIIRIVVYSPTGSSRYDLIEDWTGWRNVTMPLSSFIVYAGEGVDWSEVSQLSIRVLSDDPDNVRRLDNVALVKVGFEDP